MTTLEMWVQGSLAKALGWTLVHSLWEGAAVAFLLAIVLGIARSSKVRYAASCFAMVALLVAFGATFYRLLPREGAAAKAALAPLAVTLPADDGSIADLRTAWRASDLLPWLGPLWVVGVVLFQLRCLASWIAAGRLRRIGTCGAPDVWIGRLGELRERLRITKPVTLLESCLAEVPVVIGHLRPVILMPVGLLAGLPGGQVEAILLHELAHIRRADAGGRIVVLPSGRMVGFERHSHGARELLRRSGGLYQHKRTRVCDGSGRPGREPMGCARAGDGCDGR
jgi:beta-lactamase regulating signal transducer with metallopeptidase domain